MYTEDYKRDGVALADAFGIEYPAVFTHPQREYEALTGNVALVDLSHWGAIRLSGGDRATWLNTQITGNVETITPGQALHAALTTTKGKLVAELIVLAREAELFVLVAQGNTGDVVAAFEKHIIADDVELEDVSADTSVLSVEGPESRALVWRLFPEGPLPMEDLTFGDTEYQGMPVTVLRNNVAGGRGFHLILSGEDRRLLRNYLVQAGYGLDLELCGRDAWNMRRVEVGLPWWGSDVTDNFPAECRLEHLVDFEKGCFLGQETIARMHYRGHPNWNLVGMRPGGAGLPKALKLPFIGEEVTRTANKEAPQRSWEGSVEFPQLIGLELQSATEEKTAARVTSAVYSPALQTVLCLGYVRHTMAEPGTRFRGELDGESIELEIIQLPVHAEEK
jgi:folate-binding protein YgfZ